MRGPRELSPGVLGYVEAWIFTNGVPVSSLSSFLQDTPNPKFRSFRLLRYKLEAIVLDATHMKYIRCSAQGLGLRVNPEPPDCCDS